MKRTHGDSHPVHGLELLHSLEVSDEASFDRTHNVEGSVAPEARLSEAAASSREKRRFKVTVLASRILIELDLRVLLYLKFGLIDKL